CAPGTRRFSGPRPPSGTGWLGGTGTTGGATTTISTGSGLTTGCWSVAAENQENLPGTDGITGTTTGGGGAMAGRRISPAGVRDCSDEGTGALPGRYSDGGMATLAVVPPPGVDP